MGGHILLKLEQGVLMARITVEDCQQRVDNRFLLVQMAIKRVRQYREGYEPLITSRNKEVVAALREIAGGKVMPNDMSLYTPIPDGQEIADAEN
jgi:DNA-directed RNA polymerase subunit omega